MTFEHYRELLDAGPQITKIDVARAQSESPFAPKLLIAALAVRWALKGWSHATR